MQPITLAPSAKSLTISEVAATYGVSLRTLRYYEQRGLLSPSRIGAIRYYGPHERIRLELILKGKRLGFTLLEIERLISANLSKTADQNHGADLTVHLKRSNIRRQLQCLENRREVLAAAIAELHETLDCRDSGINNNPLKSE